jgi:hypothetical protein
MTAIPLSMPRVGAIGQSFEPERIDYLAPETGGQLGGVTAGAPIWKLEVSLNNLRPDDADAWRAWRDRQRGAQRAFLGFDLDRPFPKRHAAGFGRMRTINGTPFSGSAGGWNQAFDADDNAVLTLQSLPAGLILSPIDYVGFKWDAAGDEAGSYRRRALVRVVAGGVAAASGALSVIVEPAVPLAVPPSAIAHLDNPACLMKLVPGETRLGRQMAGYMAAGGEIVAIQDLRA